MRWAATHHSDPCGPVLLDRYGAKTTMLVGSALVLCGAFLTAVTPYFALLFVGQFLAEASATASGPMGREVSGVEMVPAHQRGRLLSGFMGVKSAGMAIGPVAGGIITQWVGVPDGVYGLRGGCPCWLFVTSLLARKDTVRVRVGKIALWGKVSDVVPDLRATFVAIVFATFSMQMYRTHPARHAAALRRGGVGLLRGACGRPFRRVRCVRPAHDPAPPASSPTVSGASTAAFPAARRCRASRSWPSRSPSTLPQLTVIMLVIGLAQGMSLGALAVSTYDVIPAEARGRLQGAAPHRGRVRRGHGSAAGRLAR